MNFRKPTFAFIAAALFAAQLFAANPWLAKKNGQSIVKADLPACEAKYKGVEFVVKNCVSATSCATTASPGFAVRQVCDYTELRVGLPKRRLVRPLGLRPPRRGR